MSSSDYQLCVTIIAESTDKSIEKTLVDSMAYDLVPNEGNAPPSIVVPLGGYAPPSLNYQFSVLLLN
jgi:hypothetical protein